MLVSHDKLCFLLNLTPPPFFFDALVPVAVMTSKTSSFKTLSQEQRQRIELATFRTPDQRLTN